MKECNRVMGGPTGSRTNRGRVGDTLLPPLSFVGGSHSCLIKGEGREAELQRKAE